MYGLIDPRSRQIFYIGKGTKNRVFEHEKESLGSPDSEKLKLKTIADIKDAGLEVEKVIINANLTEEEAFAAEASLINAFNYLNPKKMLDDIRLLCRGKSAPIKEAYERFNRETDDGRNMAEMSELLSEAINSIIDVKEESDIDSLFSVGGTSALMSDISGLDDFELICFLVVK